MLKYSHMMIIEGDSESTELEAKRICVSILGEKFRYKIEKSICSDIIFVDSNFKKSLGIDDVRRIQKNVLLSPVECDSKVYIFKNSQNITEQAQNALLKVLEDPPKNVIFIFLCTNHRKLIKTIISRSSVIFLNNTEDLLLNYKDDLIDAVLSDNKFDVLRLSSKDMDFFSKIYIL